MSPFVRGRREPMNKEESRLFEIAWSMVDVGILVACFRNCERFICRFWRYRHRVERQLGRPANFYFYKRGKSMELLCGWYLVIAGKLSGYCGHVTE